VVIGKFANKEPAGIVTVLGTPTTAWEQVSSKTIAVDAFCGKVTVPMTVPNVPPTVVEGVTPIDAGVTVRLALA